MRHRPLALALVALTSGCFGGAPPARAPSALPGDPTPQAKCGVAASHAEPLVTEWPASQKARLEARLTQGAVAVEYVGCDMRVVDACELPGSYGFKRTTLAKDQVEIGDEDELYAKMPLGAASLSGELSRSGRIAVQTVVAGQLQLSGASGKDVPADGACARATHIISGVSVGAFKLLSGGKTKVSAGGGAFGVEAGGGTSREEEVVRESGDPKACEKTGDAPNTACNSPIQLFLEALPRHKETEGLAAREGQADSAPKPGSWRVDYVAESEEQKWALVGPDGRLVCDLPCTRWTPPKSGYRLKLDAANPDDSIEWPIPDDLGYSEGRHVEVIAHLDRGGSNSAGPWLTIPGGLFALAGVGFLAIGIGAGSSDPDKGTWLGIGAGTLVVGGGTAALGVYLWSRPTGLSKGLAASADGPSFELGPGYAGVDVPGVVRAVATPTGVVGSF